jgi:hypothetical protein
VPQAFPPLSKVTTGLKRLLFEVHVLSKVVNAEQVTPGKFKTFQETPGVTVRRFEHRPSSAMCSSEICMPPQLGPLK